MKRRHLKDHYRAEASRSVRPSILEQERPRLSPLGPRHRLTAGGFTLLEIVLAVSIFVVMGAVAYQTLTNLGRSKQSLDGVRHEHLVANSVLTRLTKELQLAYAQGRPLLSPSGVQEKQGRNIYFRVDSQRTNDGYRADSISFLALNAAQYFPDGRNRSGVVQISYRLVPDPERPGSLAFLREEMPALNSSEEALKRLVQFPISRNVRGFMVSSYSSRSKQWLATWGDKAQERLPSMVQIALVVRSEDGRDHTYSTTVALTAS